MPKNQAMGYFLAGMEEENSSDKSKLSDKYVRVHDMKYQQLALRPRRSKYRVMVYLTAYPDDKEMLKPRTMKKAGETTCVFYPDQPNILLKVCSPNYDPHWPLSPALILTRIGSTHPC